MARLSFFVELAVPVQSFRADLAVQIPDAVIAREFSAVRVVVVVPDSAAEALAGLPGVISVTPDQLNHLLRRGHSGRSQD